MLKKFLFLSLCGFSFLFYDNANAVKYVLEIDFQNGNRASLFSQNKMVVFVSDETSCLPLLTHEPFPMETLHVDSPSSFPGFYTSLKKHPSVKSVTLDEFEDTIDDLFQHTFNPIHQEINLWDAALSRVEISRRALAVINEYAAKGSQAALQQKPRIESMLAMSLYEKRQSYLPQQKNEALKEIITLFRSAYRTLDKDAQKFLPFLLLEHAVIVDGLLANKTSPQSPAMQHQLQNEIIQTLEESEAIGPSCTEDPHKLSRTMLLGKTLVKVSESMEDEASGKKNLSRAVALFENALSDPLLNGHHLYNVVVAHHLRAQQLLSKAWPDVLFEHVMAPLRPQIVLSQGNSEMLATHFRNILDITNSFIKKSSQTASRLKPSFENSLALHLHKAMKDETPEEKNEKLKEVIILLRSAQNAAQPEAKKNLAYILFERACIFEQLTTKQPSPLSAFIRLQLQKEMIQHLEESQKFSASFPEELYYAVRKALLGKTLIRVAQSTEEEDLAKTSVSRALTLFEDVLQDPSPKDQKLHETLTSNRKIAQDMLLRNWRDVYFEQFVVSLNEDMSLHSKDIYALSSIYHHALEKTNHYAERGCQLALQQRPILENMHVDLLQKTMKRKPHHIQINILKEVIDLLKSSYARGCESAKPPLASALYHRALMLESSLQVTPSPLSPDKRRSLQEEMFQHFDESQKLGLNIFEEIVDPSKLNDLGRLFLREAQVTREEALSKTYHTRAMDLFQKARRILKSARNPTLYGILILNLKNAQKLL
ncbi:MAG: hypothetical protein B7Y25_07655 [Alphaproteobacteria bacterium 16-39-46]|nr:MAG: hypothetical protein B7Y25_07655 [Alphaproteobacteria bacterium 16-39-46]OZA41507.1 MAG: hypothetical protein B7X84_07845 [Alphaproteobacteria bacterium 17-39-52]HQS84787.1 hypothetical protein [Alphaproteobacteria bacterium]HQS94469.1 hypothetical protein [Alphaproteobacteria bacterium]